MKKNLDIKKRARQLQGIVVSDKMEKTIVVEVKNVKIHPLYKKRLVKSLRLKAQDMKGEAKKNDLVVIEQCRPLSSTKYYRLKKILTK